MIFLDNTITCPSKRHVGFPNFNNWSSDQPGIYYHPPRGLVPYFRLGQNQSLLALETVRTYYPLKTGQLSTLWPVSALVIKLLTMGITRCSLPQDI